MKLPTLFFSAWLLLPLAVFSQTIDITTTGLGVGMTPVNGNGPLQIAGTINSRQLSATNDTTTNLFVANVGSDATLGAMNFVIRGQPSATGANRYVGLFVADASATRPLVLQETGGNVGVGTTAPSIAGGYTPKLHLAGAYAAIALEATTPAEKWGIGVDSTGALDIFKSTSNSYAGRLLITNAGNVGIGTASPGSKLEVNGSVRATSFISNSTTYADFVFKPDYKLRSLADLESAIRREGHLPDIPSEAEVMAHGVDLANQQAKLLQKVEELTLYVIEHQKELTQLREENAALREKVATWPTP